MGNFDNAFEEMIKNEGGYKLHRVSGDRGGLTYAGISRKYHPNWPGWSYIDNGEIDNADLTGQVKQFYRRQFWEKIKGDEIREQTIVFSLFDFAANAGCRTAIKLA
ncbi:MAG: N-acetylmuramidase, partial [Desulfobacteraceae bacterium]|nr:N-acetylmuramidase [Desulfobacteraceae bacterium]